MTAFLREPRLNDEKEFLKAMQESQHLHHPWVKAPLTSQEFREYIARAESSNNKYYFVCAADNHIAGIFNISEIVCYHIRRLVSKSWMMN